MKAKTRAFAHGSHQKPERTSVRRTDWRRNRSVSSRQIDDLPGGGNKSVDGWQSTALRRYGLIGDFGLA